MKRIKLLTGIVALVGVNNLSPAESFRLEGEPFNPSTNSEIVWSAPTNNLPRGLWIYKVMPEAFSAAVVSNAMNICHFQKNDLAQPPDKNQIVFKNKNKFNQSHVLSIAPTLGGMDYNSQWDYKIPIEDVPSSDEAETLARDILFQLGIDRSSLADKVQKGYDDTSTRYDRQHNQVTPRYYNGVGKESLDFLYPYADLEMTADSGNTNATIFFLQCPILTSEVYEPLSP